MRTVCLYSCVLVSYTGNHLSKNNALCSNKHSRVQDLVYNLCTLAKWCQTNQIFMKDKRLSCYVCLYIYQRTSYLHLINNLIF